MNESNVIRDLAQHRENLVFLGDLPKEKRPRGYQALVARIFADVAKAAHQMDGPLADQPLACFAELDKYKLTKPMTPGGEELLRKMLRFVDVEDSGSDHVTALRECYECDELEAEPGLFAPKNNCDVEIGVVRCKRHRIIHPLTMKSHLTEAPKKP